MKHTFIFTPLAIGLSVLSLHAFALPTNSTALTLERRAGNDVAAQPKVKAQFLATFDPDYDQYKLGVEIGNPPQRFDLFLDTGSHLSWVLSQTQASEALKSAIEKAEKPFFDPAKSGSFKSPKQEAFTQQSTIRAAVAASLNLNHLNLPGPNPIITTENSKYEECKLTYGSGQCIRVNLVKDDIVLRNGLDNVPLKYLAYQFGMVKDIGPLFSIPGIALNPENVIEDGISGSGLLAVGLQPLDEEGKRHGPSFFESIAPSLESPIMKIKFPYEKDGVISFGHAIDNSDRLNADAPVFRSPIFASPREPKWRLKMSKRIRVGASTQQMEYPMTLDTGSRKLSLPLRLAEFLWQYVLDVTGPDSVLKIQVSNRDVVAYFLRCDAIDNHELERLKTFSFPLGADSQGFLDMKYVFPKEYTNEEILSRDVKKISKDGRETVENNVAFCQSRLYGVPDSPNARYLLGLPFFYSNVVAFELDPVAGKHHISWTRQKY